MSWKNLLKRHDELAKNGRKQMYARVNLLMKISEDDSFRKEYSLDIQMKFLDEKLSDTCANFRDMKIILKMFPREEQWSNGDIKRMLEVALTSMATKIREDKKEKDSSEQRLSWKQKFIELEGKYLQLEAAHKQLEKDYRELQKHLQRKAS